MKNILISYIFCLLTNFLFAEGTEEVCVITNTGSSGMACNPTSLGARNPCETVPFVIHNVIPPSEYPLIAKYEWFVNSVSVKTTTNANDNGLNWVITAQPISVYCLVTYKKFAVLYHPDILHLLLRQ